MKIEELFEARSNPELNRKVSAYESLKKYAGQPNVFVSFTLDVGDISHSPKKLSHSAPRNGSGSKFGINPSSTFSTPIGIYCYPVDYVLERPPRKGDGGFQVPFAGNSPFLQVFKASGNILNLQTYSKSDLERDREILRKKYPDFFRFSFMNEDTILEFTPPPINPGRRIWNLTSELASLKVNTNTKIERPKPMAHWSNLFRMLGYVGVVDNGGKIIFPAEPTQAVFFDIRALKLLETIRNINPRTDIDAKQKTV